MFYLDVEFKEWEFNKWNLFLKEFRFVIKCDMEIVIVIKY